MSASAVSAPARTLLSVLESLREFMNAALTGSIHEENRLHYDKLATDAIDSARATVNGQVPELRYFAVSGRIPGDDEDTTLVVEASDRDAAIALFSDELWDGQGSVDDRQRVEDGHGTDTYVNSIVASDHPIEVL